VALRKCSRQKRLARNSVLPVETDEFHGHVVNIKRIFCIGLLAAIAGAGCFTDRHPATNEPSYQGRLLSEWLGDFDTRNYQPKKQAVAADAIRHIGSQAVPFIVDRLSEVRWKQFTFEMQKWRDKEEAAAYPINRPANPRHDAFAGLDALGSVASDALPTLEKLVQQDPPDLQALYVIARIGPAGLPFLTESLTNQVKAIRLAAKVCLDMMNSHSEMLYPQISAGPEAHGFDRRLVKFNLEITRAAYLEYCIQHPEMNSPTNLPDLPPPSIPVPVQ
jgi:hypothetical protein